MWISKIQQGIFTQLSSSPQLYSMFQCLLTDCCGFALTTLPTVWLQKAKSGTLRRVNIRLPKILDFQKSDRPNKNTRIRNGIQLWLDLMSEIWKRINHQHAYLPTHAHTHSLHIVFSYFQITASQRDELNGLLSSPEFDKSHLELWGKKALSIYGAT